MLYVAETMAARILRFKVDLDTGQLSERTVFVEGFYPDNLELDETGDLWVAAPLTNELIVVDTATGDLQSVFRSQSLAQEELAAEIERRIAAGESWLELFTPECWEPLPGVVTGVILSPGGGPIYLAGLGDALVRLPR